MGSTLLILSLLVAALALDASAAKGCPAGKGACVEKKNCKDGQPNGSRHKCFLANDQQGVCCDKCVTAKGGPGTCVEADQCGKYTRDRFVPQNELQQWWKTEVCYEKKNTKFYCCPLELQKPTAGLKSTPKATAKSRDDNAFPSCQTPQKQPGRCVPLRLCDGLYDSFLHRRTNRLETLLWNSRCQSNAVDSTSICCPIPQNPDDLLRHRKAEKLGLVRCGQISMANKILEGNVADLGQFPWMANIMYYYKRNTKVTLCSGSLIHPKYVLTAAHCQNASHARAVSIRLGEYDLSTGKDCVDGVCAKQILEYTIAKWIIHENNPTSPRHYDIALVKLSQPAKIIPNQISPICLPLTKQWLMTKPSELTVTGWGLMGNQRYSDVLMQANLQVTDDGPEEYCRAEELFCARGANLEGHCGGDSGGPLQQIVRYGRKYRMVQFGVVSGGAKECKLEDDTPGVSVMVGYHLRWILDNMEI